MVQIKSIIKPKSIFRRKYEKCFLLCRCFLKIQFLEGRMYLRVLYSFLYTNYFSRFGGYAMQYSTKKHTKLFISLLIVGMLIPLFSVNVNAESEGNSADEYVAQIIGSPTLEELKKEIEQFGGKLISYREQVATFYIKHDGAIKFAEESYLVTSVEENEKFQLLQIEEPDTLTTNSEPVQYSHELTNVKNAWSQGYTGKGVKIAVLDTGVTAQKDLKVAGGISFVHGVQSYADDRGHGTHVAGIISALNNGIGTTGVAHEAEIYSVKVLSETGRGNVAEIARGINWAVRQNIDIINLSLSSTATSSILKEAIYNASKKGIIVVSAAGNAGEKVEFPATLDNVVSVGSVDNTKQLSWFSSKGPELNIVAPGEDIVSTGSDGYFQFKSGTSQATPYVTGMLALYIQAFPKASSEEVVLTMYNQATDLGEFGRDDLFGHGLVQFPKKVANIEISPSQIKYQQIVREKAEKSLKETLRNKLKQLH